LEFRVNSQNLKLASYDAEAFAFERGDLTGMRVWSAAPILVKWLEGYAEQDSAFSSKRVIELGSGTGLVGMAAAALGAARVILTERKPPIRTISVSSDGDVEEIHQGVSAEPLKLLSGNVVRNRNSFRGDVEVEELEWGDSVTLDGLLPLGPFDLVIGADVVYSPQDEHIVSLFKTMRQLLSFEREGKAKAVLSWQERPSNRAQRIQNLLSKEQLEIISWERIHCSSQSFVVCVLSFL